MRSSYHGDNMAFARETAPASTRKTDEAPSLETRLEMSRKWFEEREKEAQSPTLKISCLYGPKLLEIPVAPGLLRYRETITKVPNSNIWLREVELCPKCKTDTLGMDGSEKLCQECGLVVGIEGITIR